MPTAPATPRAPSRVLVVRLSAIGDVVHTLPAAAALAAAGHEVLWAVQPAALPLVDRNPAVARAITLPARRSTSRAALGAALGALRAAHPEVALDFQGLWKSAFWARASGAARRVGFAGSARREPLSALLLNERLPAPAVRHVVDKNLALLAALGIAAVGERRFPLPPVDREEARVARGLAELGIAKEGAAKPLLLHPGGGWPGKLWPAEKYGALAQALARRGIPTLVTWGPGEEELATRVVAISEGRALKCFPATLLELVALARAAAGMVAADTGPLHLAAAAGAPVVALFGPTDPERNGPWDPADRVAARRPPCFPCHRRACPRHAGVMAEIPVEEVATAVEARLGV